MARNSEPSQLRRRIQKIHCTAVCGIAIMYLVSHAWSTATRARRFAPEFVQCIFEDLTFCAIAVSAFSMVLSQQKFHHLIKTMENMSTANKAKQVGTKVITYLLVALLGCISVVAISILQSWVPLSEEEYNIRRLVYDDTKYPEKVLPSMVKIPGVDETLSWTYEILLLVHLFLSGSYICIIVVLFTLLPLSVLHLEGW